MRIKGNFLKFKIYESKSSGKNTKNKKEIYSKSLIDIKSIVIKKIHKELKLKDSSEHYKIKEAVLKRNKDYFISIDDMFDVGDFLIESNNLDFLHIEVERFSFLESIFSLPNKKEIKIKSIDLNFLTDNTIDNLLASEIYFDNKSLKFKFNKTKKIDLRTYVVKYSKEEDIYKLFNSY